MVEQGSTSASTSSEVHRVNRLLQIEHLDWSHQLTQAVSDFS